MIPFDSSANALDFDFPQSTEQAEHETGENHPIDESSWQVDNYPY